MNKLTESMKHKTKHHSKKVINKKEKSQGKKVQRKNIKNTTTRKRRNKFRKPRVSRKSNKSQKHSRYMQKGGFSVPLLNDLVTGARMIPYGASNAYYSFNPPATPASTNPANVNVNPAPFKDQFPRTNEATVLDETVDLESSFRKAFA